MSDPVLVERASLRPGAWDTYVTDHVDGWFWHTTAWLDYQLTYRPGSRDVSVAAVADGRIVGVAPMIVDLDGVVNFDGHPPRIASSPHDQSMGRLLTAYCTDGEIRRWETWSGPSRAARVQNGSLSVSTRIVTLDQPEVMRWRQLRRSYHAIIHTAERRYRIEVGRHPELVETYTGLHCAQASKSRSTKTYDLQHRWVRRGDALVAVAYGREDGIPVAAVYVIVYKDRAYYASAPSTVPNVQHALQWQLLRALPDYGVSRYEMGYVPRQPTEKERNIQVFKTGFGGADEWYEVHDVRFEAPAG